MKSPIQPSPILTAKLLNDIRSGDAQGMDIDQFLATYFPATTFRESHDAFDKWAEENNIEWNPELLNPLDPEGRLYVYVGEAGGERD